MAKDFSKSEAELWDVVDTLRRAISIIQGEMAKNPAFTRNLNNVVAAFHCSSRCGSASSVCSGTVCVLGAALTPIKEVEAEGGC